MRRCEFRTCSKCQIIRTFLYTYDSSENSLKNSEFFISFPGIWPTASALNSTLFRCFKKRTLFNRNLGIWAQNFLAPSKPVGKGKASWSKAHTFYKHLTLYYTHFFPITKQNNRIIVFSLLIKVHKRIICCFVVKSWGIFKCTFQIQ